jgi:hypothetical protein
MEKVVTVKNDRKLAEEFLGNVEYSTPAWYLTNACVVTVGWESTSILFLVSLLRWTGWKAKKQKL